MKFGINTFLWTAEFGASHFALLPVIQEHGFTGVEVSLFEAARFPAAAIRDAVEKAGLECTVCSVIPGKLSLLSEDAAVRQATVGHLRDCIAATAEAGARVIAGPLYSPVGYLPGRRRNANEWAWAIEAYKELGPVLAEYQVTLAIEPLNRFETYFLNTTEDAVRLCAEVDHPQIGILWDTFHANIEEKDSAAALLSTGKYLKHVHTCENDRGTPGTGHVDWDGVFNALRQLAYNDWLTIESFGFALGEISAAASIWRDLAAKPEDIAWDGITFLRKNVRPAAAARMTHAPSA